MNTQHVLIETLTPLHVGSGRMLQGNTEYLYFGSERTVAVVNERKVLGIIGEENLDTWIGIINRGEDLLAYLQKRKPGIGPTDTARRILSVLGGRTPGGNQTIREQLFSGNGQPILPGSSLKGAVRTAVLNALIQANPAAARRINEFKRYDERKQKNIYTGQRLESKYFSNVSNPGEGPNHDVFRLLRIGDAHFKQTVCLLSETLNEKGDGSFEMKESVKQFIECIPAGAEALCRVQIPAELKARLNENRYAETARKIPHRDRMEWAKLLVDINANTQRLIQNELNRYQWANMPDGAVDYLDSLKSVMTGLQTNQCVIRVGFGTGYLNMTGGWPEAQWPNVPGLDFKKEMADLAEGVRRNARYNAFALPKSRKMALGGVPLGFLKLTVFSEAEWETWQQQAGQREAEKARLAESTRARVAQEAAEHEAKRIADEEEIKRKEEEARKPQMHTGPISKGLEVDAEVTMSGKPNRVNIYVVGQEGKQYEMVESAPQPLGYICRVALVMEKGKILRVRHLRPK